ncbi:STAS domain-containing protein [Sulfurimonas sp. SAG-AH-194-I05]|nr:STAS domain-containing protein [Sulfurimonas sp. SAG-AH-194-I05]MDF1874208.1 STAS domain-containing protein [Sulfurimonas sp. SAG-AH-194-I05]
MIIDKNELSIYDVEELRKELLTQLTSGEIKIDISHIEKVDMSVIQLFIAAKKSCIESSILFQLSNASEELHAIFEHAGCLSLLGVCDE